MAEKLVIGLTGGIGSGKTAVSDRFAALGITIADADIAARRVVEPGTTALEKIIEHFGHEFRQQDGTLDRARLRNVVFTNHAERKWLESVTVPAILTELHRTIAESQSPYDILMLSSGSGKHPLIKRQLVVDVPEEVQISRVMARDSNSREQVLAIMATQPSRQARLDYADDVITNDGNLTRLDTEVNRLHQQYLILSGETT